MALPPGPAGQGASADGDRSDRIVLSYYDGASGDLRVLWCLNPGCGGGANGSVNVAAVTAGDVGWSSAIWFRGRGSRA